MKSPTKDKNGFIVAPDCEDKCFIDAAECYRVYQQVELHNVGQYIAFPSIWYHHGHYIVQLENMFFAAQLFAKPTLDANTEQLACQSSTLNSLTANPVLGGEKLVLFGKYLLNFYLGIIHYILRETKTLRAKIYLPTSSAKKIQF
jgi:hypothetical protein